MPAPSVGLFVALGAVACGGASPPPAAAPATAPPPSATPATPAAKAAEPPVLIEISTFYQDFSGHGSNASGPWYRKEADGAWTSASCATSHVSDPRAGKSAPPTCSEWKPVPKEQWDVLENALHPTPQFTCDERPDVCKALGLAQRPPRTFEP